MRVPCRREFSGHWRMTIHAILLNGCIIDSAGVSRKTECLFCKAMMSRLRAWIRSFFGFSRTETNAFLILLPLMLVLIFSEPAYRYWFVRQPQDFSRERAELDSLMANWKWEEPDSVSDETAKPQLVSFNPNHAGRDELIALGFTRSLADRILNYRSKGGKFVVKKDLMKIYGMDSLFYKRILASIDLPEATARKKIAAKPDAPPKPALPKFDLNRADTAQLIALRGIGPKLALRIIAYREKLGGFISADQLKEVYGLDTAVVRELFGKSFIEKDFMPRLININQATEQELAAHPYIRYKLAKAITAYRFQHGPYRSLDDLRRITLIPESAFQKIKPYLSANP